MKINAFSDNRFYAKLHWKPVNILGDKIKQLNIVDLVENIP